MQAQTTKRNKIRLVACALLFSCCGASTAQTLPNQPVTPSDLVLLYLQQDMFLSPGSGFQAVRIGQTFDHAAKVWGNPKKAQRQRLNGAIQWTYEAADGTRLILNGKQTIQLISVVGASNSLYQSAQGARFGMTPGEVARLYRGPTPRRKVKQLSYPRLGISFRFASGTLAAMQVFAPSNRK